MESYSNLCFYLMLGAVRVRPFAAVYVKPPLNLLGFMLIFGGLFWSLRDASINSSSADDVIGVGAALAGFGLLFLANWGQSPWES